MTSAFRTLISSMFVCVAAVAGIFAVPDAVQAYGEGYYQGTYYEQSYYQGYYEGAYTSSTGNTTTVYLTHGSTWTVPSDWVSSNNSVEVIGAGAGGGASTWWSSGGGGGGGGGYSKVTNVTFAPGATVGYSVGVGGTSGAPGGDTYFCASTSNCDSVSASAVVVGARGGTSGGNGYAGVGGSAVVGSIGYAGGSGGAPGLHGGGGGGAAGPNAAGTTGAYLIGGAGDGGAGGAGGSFQAIGSNGAEWDSTHGAGGGGGAGAYPTGSGAAGGSYGAGGGGGGEAAITWGQTYAPGGAGGAGLIVIRYSQIAALTPPSCTLSSSSAGVNSGSAATLNYTITAPSASSGNPVTLFLTSGSTWTVPNDWTSANSAIEVIGGGGGGCGNNCQGGGGGAYSKISNVVLTPGSVVGIQVGRGGAGSGGDPGASGTDTFVCNSTSNCSAITGSAVIVGAKAGRVTVNTAEGLNPGGLGGDAASGVGTIRYSGGNGGSYQTTGGGGGGGAAGKYGAGNAGGSTNGGCVAMNGAPGGQGDSIFGGLGGSASVGDGNPGGNGSEWNATHGSGGGGGGGEGTCGVEPHAGGAAGLYGAGGGGGGYGLPGGAGAPGLITITYVPNATAVTASINGVTVPATPSGAYTTAALTTPASYVMTVSNGAGSRTCGPVAIGINASVQTGTPITGYGWSDTVGWIDFNCANTHSCATRNWGMAVRPDGTINGFAWSDNVGWISANTADLSGCPSGICKASLAGPVMNGWFKVLSAGDGWDGWISLKGANYGPVFSAGAFRGFAWGSDVVGWVQFDAAAPFVQTDWVQCTPHYYCSANDQYYESDLCVDTLQQHCGYQCVSNACVNPPAPSGTLVGGIALKAKPTLVKKFGTATITWGVTNASSCTVQGSNHDVWSGLSGTATTSPIVQRTVYTLSCLDLTGASTTVATAIVSLAPVWQER